VLAAAGLRFAYEADRPVLTGADLALHAGRRVAVLGPNGGGKTTLFRLLVGALEPGSGQVLLDGSPVRRTRRGLTALREQVQLVLQDPDDQLFAASVAQDVSFGPVNMGLPSGEVARRVEDALAALGIGDLADRPTHLLSFGQKKRAAIAGAVAMRPRLLVLDEPTAGLDPAGVEELLVTLAARRRDDAGAVDPRRRPGLPLGRRGGRRRRGSGAHRPHRRRARRRRAAAVRPARAGVGARRPPPARARSAPPHGVGTARSPGHRVGRRPRSLSGTMGERREHRRERCLRAPARE
jgi:cobalt transport protein ATP-binding subunit